MPSIATTNISYSDILIILLHIMMVYSNYVPKPFPIIAILHLKSSKFLLV